MAILPGETRRAFSSDEEAAAELHLTNLVRFLDPRSRHHLPGDELGRRLLQHEGRT